MLHFDESAVLGWPCVRRQAPNDGGFWFDLRDDCTMPEVRLVVDLADVRATFVEWLAPVVQAKRCGMPTSSFPPAFRAFAVGDEDTLLRTAAFQAFWRLGRTYLAQVAAVAGISLSGCDTLCSTLFVMVKHSLGVEDGEVLQILSKRLNMEDTVDGMHTAALLEMDEAKELLERSDRQRAEQEQRDIMTEATPD